MEQYHRAIFFTKVPLKGYYRYKDVFQIFPFDMDKMPTSIYQKHYPNVIEFKSTGEEEFTIPEQLKGLENLHQQAAILNTYQDKYFSLLTTFSNNLFFRYNDISGFWGVPILIDNPTDEEANCWSSKWCMSIYYFPDYAKQFQGKKFTELNLNEIQKIPHKDYFLNDPNLDFDTSKELLLPSTIDLLFDRFFSLEEQISKIVETATSYNYSAIELKDSRKTLSLLASFTALETMVNLEYKDVKVEVCNGCGQNDCKGCGQPKHKVSKKFREFLLKYIGNSQKNKKKFNDYYSFRSKIVHTGQQLKSEPLFSDVSEVDIDNERITRIEILQLGKLAVSNWLLSKNNFEYEI